MIDTISMQIASVDMPAEEEAKEELDNIVEEPVDELD